MPFFGSLFGSATPVDNLRIIVTRHGERTDLALGPGWSRHKQNGHIDPRVSYLAPRADFREWEYDPALTVKGERQGRSTGRKLFELGCAIDYCYSSPAYRSIQTATQILRGQNRKAVPINIEPGRKSNDRFKYLEFDLILLVKQVYLNVLPGMLVYRLPSYLQNI
jgi:broad specificity phosphatase PhoE